MHTRAVSIQVCQFVYVSNADVNCLLLQPFIMLPHHFSERSLYRSVTFISCTIVGLHLCYFSNSASSLHNSRTRKLELSIYMKALLCSFLSSIMREKYIEFQSWDDFIFTLFNCCIIFLYKY